MSCCVPLCPNDIKINKDISYHIFPHPEKEQYRHNEWMTAINSSKLFSKKPMLVYRQYRVCRRHFDQDCFNGGCKRLLHTAIPSLFLNSSEKSKIREITRLPPTLTTKPSNISYIERLEDEFREEINYDNNTINCEEMEVLEYEEDNDSEENGIEIFKILVWFLILIKFFVILVYENYLLDDREEEFIDSPEEITGDLEDTQIAIDEYEVLDVIDVVEDGAFIKCELIFLLIFIWNRVDFQLADF